MSGGVRELEAEEGETLRLLRNIDRRLSMVEDLCREILGSGPGAPTFTPARSITVTPVDGQAKSGL